KTDSSDRRTFRTSTSWLPFSGYIISPGRWKPFSTLSLSNNLLLSTEDSETTGFTKRVISKTFPDLIVTLNDIEDIFNIQRVLDQSRLVLKANRRKTETVSATR